MVIGVLRNRVTDQPCWVGTPVPLFAAATAGINVRFHHDLPKATVFVGVELGGRFLPVGTGFLVGVERRGFRFSFMVTADHVVDMIKGDDIWVRLNRREGPASTIKLPKARRMVPLEKQYDLALFAIGLDATVHDQVVIGVDRAMLKEAWEKYWCPGAGDEVATVGLYSSHFGQTKNLPVGRIGHISLLPGEPVLTHRGYVSAYLIEGKSIAGLSGSPVFLTPPYVRVKDKQVEFLTDPVAIPLGMITGYHIVASAEDQILVPQIQGDDLPDDGPSIDERNIGFAVAIPYERILDMLESDFLEKDMDVSINNHLKNSGFRPASVAAPMTLSPDPAPLATDENPKHREDFKSLLHVAGKKSGSKD